MPPNCYKSGRYKQEKNMQPFVERILNDVHRDSTLAVTDKTSRELSPARIRVLESFATAVSRRDLAGRGVQSRGRERSYYRDGDIFLLETRGAGLQIRKECEENGLKANFLLCVGWTGDCHHKFLPLRIAYGHVAAGKPVYGYEHFGRAIYHADPEKFVELMARQPTPSPVRVRATWGSMVF
jgi:hypothetical protein